MWGYGWWNGGGGGGVENDEKPLFYQRKPWVAERVRGKPGWRPPRKLFRFVWQLRVKNPKSQLYTLALRKLGVSDLIGDAGNL